MVVHGRHAEAVHRVVESIRAEGGEAMAALANLADAKECTAFVSRSRPGPVDILINNAGAFANRSWENASPEDWLELYALNVAAVVRCVQGFLPVMRWRVGSDHPDRYGRGDQPVPHDARLRRHQGGAAEPHRVTVEVPEAQRHHRQHRQPGIVVTPASSSSTGKASRRGWGEDWAAIEAGVLAEILDNPVGRLGRPSEVADLVAFVASPLAGYVNGANLRIDGGSTAVVWLMAMTACLGLRGGAAHHRTGEVPAVRWQWPAGVGAVLGDDDLR